jgi:dihydrodipicolinate synthase/N-acetylneuraminate lyase
VRFALERGAHGLVCFGLAGEVSKLSAGERKSLTTAILEEANGRVPVFVGAGADTVRTASVLALYAEQAGASCVVLPAPPLASPDEDALVDYFVRIATRLSVPVMIQEAPEYLGTALGPRVIEKVAEQAPNVRLLKLEAGPELLSQWRRELGDDFRIWGGDGGMYLLDCMRVGAAGIIPGVDLVDFLVEIWEAERGDDPARADELFQRLLPMLVFEMQHSIDHFNACAKEVLVRRGVLGNPALRGPAATLGETSLRLLDRHLAALALDDVGTHAVT